MKTHSSLSFRVLLVDDEPAWLDSLSLSLERTTGITNMILCDDSRKVKDILSAENVGLVILDLTMPHVSGLELLEYISEHYPTIKVIILTGLNQIETAVSCMKLGAFDYFVKTEEEQRLARGVLSAIRMIELQMENSEISTRLLSDSLHNPSAFSGIVSICKKMRSIFQYIESVAGSSQPILITGESGVGKELAAQAIHALSGRNRLMISVNVAGLDDHMFTDTLFGHTKGAYTGASGLRNGLIEEAADGTLFLDEIGDLSISSQVKLLRVLNNGDYFPLGSDRPKFSRARIIVATNQDLNRKIESDVFRKDLYFRLRTHRVHLPPLRERHVDLPLLLDHFIEEAAKEFEKEKPAVSGNLLRLLKSYHFPGNVRELRSMVYDAVARHQRGLLQVSSFLDAMGMPEFSPVASSDVSTLKSCGNIYSTLSQLPFIDEAIELLVDEAMNRTGNNQSMTARLLGISQSALNKRLKRTGKR